MTRASAAALAVDGGRPVRRDLLPYGRQTVLAEDVRAVAKVLRSPWLTTGPAGKDFERAFAGRVGAKHAVALSSGTAALHAAVFAAGLEKGDEAVVTPFTFCATANCLLYQGARPVFADVSQDTLNLDPAAAEKRITSKTKAIIPVDYAGHPADLAAFRALADKRGLTLIEDACHALGAEHGGKRVGGHGHMTVFSFHPVKHITTGEGGMVTTDDDRLAARLRTFRNHGIDGDARSRMEAGRWFYEMTELGYNYRLSDVSAALGLSQLRRLDANLRRRREIAFRYAAAFRGLPLVLPPSRPGVRHAWHLYPVRLDLKRFKTGRDRVFQALRAEGLGVNVHYIPVHLHPYYRKTLGGRPGQCPRAESAYEALVTLPLFHGMKERDVADVIAAVRKVVTAYAS